MAAHYSIILVETQLPENLGATARAMANFGCSDLRLVNPEIPADHPKAVAMAVKTGQPVLEGAKVFHSLKDALHDCHYTFATTCLVREQIKQVYTPESAARMCMENAIAHEPRMGLVFGPERTGLSNGDIAECQHMLTVETVGSLNLGQAVLLMLYGMRTAEKGMTQAYTQIGDTLPASQKDVQAFFNFLEERLDDANFWREPRKKRIMWQNVRNIFHRSHLTEQETRTLMGMVRALFSKRSGEA